MRFSTTLLLIAATIFVICGTSWAELTGSSGEGATLGEILSGPIVGINPDVYSTGVDNGVDTGSGLQDFGTGDSPFSGENSGDIVPPLSSGIIDSGIIIPPPVTPPSLIISEIFFDGSDERVEISNLGTIDFSGSLQLTGIGINAVIPSFIPSQTSIVIGRSGRSFAYMLDQGVITNFTSMGFTDTKAISVSLIWSGETLDDFFADTGMVTHYNDKKTSLEKEPNGSEFIVTGATLDRSWNVSTEYIANPGRFQFETGNTTGEVDSGSSSGLVIIETGGLPIDCQGLSGATSVSVSEVFFGNAERDSYIEIHTTGPLPFTSLIFSGSLLTESITVYLDTISGSLNQERDIIITAGLRRGIEDLLQVDNHQLSIQKSGGRLLILEGGRQSGQVLDIAYVIGQSGGNSSYHQDTLRSCARVLDKKGVFSPGFSEKFLKYFPGPNGTPMICPSSTIIVTTGSQSCLASNTSSNTSVQTGSIISTGAIPSEISGSSIPESMRKSVRIVSVDYDPEGSDTMNEKITLEAPELSGNIDLTKGRYLMIGTRKRYLWGIITGQDQLTLQATFGFPNTTKDQTPIVVQIWNTQTLVDTFTYIPGQIQQMTGAKNILTGEYLVTTVIDGDTFKIAYKTGEQSIRLLGLDAPEISLLRTKKKGCFAEESKQYLSSLLLNKIVTLAFDPTQNKTDSYKRWLNYVYVDGASVNQDMIEKGYAKEYTFKVPYTERSTFLDSQQYAQDQKLGLRNPIVCPENATGKVEEGTGDEFSWRLEAKILWIIPNPKGKDDQEQFSLEVNSEGGTTNGSGTKFITGLYLQINGKKKKISTSIPVGEEAIISGSLGLLNKAACVSLVFQEKILDTLCYAQPTEGQKIYSDGTTSFDITPQEQNVLASLAFQKKGNELCMMFGAMEIDCRNIPSSKTPTKLKNENKIYKSFSNELNKYMRENWGDVYYNSSTKIYFDLLRAAKKNIDQGIYTFSTSHGVVSLYDISQQLEVMETYSLGYWAKKFGMVLLNQGATSHPGAEERSIGG